MHMHACHHTFNLPFNSKFKASFNVLELIDRERLKKEEEKKKSCRFEPTKGYF